MKPKINIKTLSKECASKGEQKGSVHDREVTPGVTGAKRKDSKEGMIEYIE